MPSSGRRAHWPPCCVVGIREEGTHCRKSAFRGQKAKIKLSHQAGREIKEGIKLSKQQIQKISQPSLSDVRNSAFEDTFQTHPQVLLATLASGLILICCGLGTNFPDYFSLISTFSDFPEDYEQFGSAQREVPRYSGVNSHQQAGALSLLR